MDYLFCILAAKEAERLSSLPDSVKKGFEDKITTMSLGHVAKNDVPDYILEEIKSEEEQVEEDYWVEEEIEDDSKTKIEDMFGRDVDSFSIKTIASSQIEKT